MKPKLLLPLLLAACLLVSLTPFYPATAAASVPPQVAYTATTSLAAAAPVIILKFTKTVERGGKAIVIIKTTPGATCHLAYRTPSGRLSTTRGLGKKTANLQGLCRWSWNIYRKTKPGIGSVTITVNGVGNKYPIVIR
jgi:hypothetical protein